MKRDMDLIKSILLVAENSDSYKFNYPVVDGVSEQTIDYHLLLMHEGNLIELDYDESEDGEILVNEFRLTWFGHEFLDASKNIGIWNKIKLKAKEKAMNLPFSVINQVMIELVKAEFKHVIS